MNKDARIPATARILALHTTPELAFLLSKASQPSTTLPTTPSTPANRERKRNLRERKTEENSGQKTHDFKSQYPTLRYDVAHPAAATCHSVVQAAIPLGSTLMTWWLPWRLLDWFRLGFHILAQSPAFRPF